MGTEVERRMNLCRDAQDPDWNGVIALAGNLEHKEREFLVAHPPGLVKALWDHYRATQDGCGCASPSHEKASCTVMLVERLLADEQAI